MDLPTFAMQLLNAVQYGLVLFLVASGLTLVFGILGVINLGRVCKGCAVGWAPPSSGREALRVDGCAVAAFGAASAP